MSQQSRLMHVYEGPDCVICGDSGLHDKRGFYEFCKCPVGLVYKASHPDAAREANEKVARLRAATA